MSKGPTRVQRLVRINQFREELASGALRSATSQERQAREGHESAVGDVDRIGDWKVKGSEARGLDLSFYNVALGLESQAMVRADELKQTLTASEKRTEQAQAGLVDAACAMRVSENRGKREQSAAEMEQEKRSFDQISDVWLNNRDVAP